MIIFWLIFSILIVIALAFVLPPLWQSSGEPEAENAQRNEANVGLYRDQLAELEADLRNGISGQDQYEKDREEIERRLLEDVSLNAPAPRSEQSSGDKRAFTYAFAIAFPLLVIGFYWKVGNPGAISGSAATDASTTTGSGANDMSQQRIEANVASLAKRLEANPADGPGWTMLARSYTSMEKYPEARDAYAKATAIVTNDADLWAEYAFAMAMASDRQLQGKPSELIDRALKINPENLKALELAGSAAFQGKNYKQAIEYWQLLLSKVPPGSEVGQSVTRRINEAKSLANTK